MKTEFEELLEWMESWTTLHWQVHVLYVVSGYQVTLEQDGNEIYGPFEGLTYTSAIKLAMDIVGMRA
jgi:hypothetical protein